MFAIVWGSVVLAFPITLFTPLSMFAIYIIYVIVVVISDLREQKRKSLEQWLNTEMGDVGHVSKFF